MTQPDRPIDPWPWLELPLIPSVERYLQGLETERASVRLQATYMQAQLRALGR